MKRAQGWVWETVSWWLISEGLCRDFLVLFSRFIPELE